MEGTLTWPRLRRLPHTANRYMSGRRNHLQRRLCLSLAGQTVDGAVSNIVAPLSLRAATSNSNSCELREPAGRALILGQRHLTTPPQNTYFGPRSAERLTYGQHRG